MSTSNGKDDCSCYCSHPDDEGLRHPLWVSATRPNRNQDKICKCGCVAPQYIPSDCSLFSKLWLHSENESEEKQRKMRVSDLQIMRLVTR